jgi:Protein of unknown function (DUF3987)
VGHRTAEPFDENQPKATNAHICILGHITKAELLRYLTEIEMANGYANRFLWAMVRRSKKISNPTGMPDSVLNRHIIDLKRAVDAAREIGEMRRDEAAERRWVDLYDELSVEQPGLLGAITARAEVQVMRLAAIYAAMDGTALITCDHLEAALAVWRYCEASARYIFGDNTGDPVADRIIEALGQQGAMARTAIWDLFGRHMSQDQNNRAIAMLQQAKRISVQEMSQGRGRPLTVITLTREK